MTSRGFRDSPVSGETDRGIPGKRPVRKDRPATAMGSYQTAAVRKMRAVKSIGRFADREYDERGLKRRKP